MNLVFRAIISTIIISTFCNIALANTIEETLICDVVETEDISVGTGGPNDISIVKQKRDIETRVVISPFISNSIHIVWAPDTTHEEKFIYRLGFSEGSRTQYIGVKGDSVVTYFGKNSSGSHILIRFDTLDRHDGGVGKGWRLQEFSNYILRCSEQ